MNKYACGYTWTRNMIRDEHELKVTSQQGEDGIIAEIFRKILTTNKYYVEFGAGESYDNTEHLDKEGWSGLLLGGDGKDKTGKGRDIKKEWITHENIANLFGKYDVPISFDFLSIDTDYYDYWILKSILSAGYRPRVICAEINRNCYPYKSLTIPKKTEQTMWENGDDYFGLTPNCLVILGAEFGYKLVYCERNAVNCFLVHNPPSGMEQNLDNVFKCRNIHESSGEKLWHNLESGMNILSERISTNYVGL